MNTYHVPGTILDTGNSPIYTLLFRDLHPSWRKTERQTNKKKTDRNKHIQKSIEKNWVVM